MSCADIKEILASGKIISCLIFLEQVERIGIIIFRCFLELTIKALPSWDLFCGKL